MLSSSGAKFEYWLPRTVVRFSGHRTTTVDSLAHAPATVEYDAQVNCVELADPEFSFILNLDGTALRDVNGTVEFTADRRLSSFSGDSTGTAGAVVGGVTRFVSSVFGLVVAAGKPHVGGLVSGVEAEPEEMPTLTEFMPVDAEAQYAVECAEAAAHRSAVRSALKVLRATIVSAASDPEQASRLRTLLASLSALMQMQADADAHFAAWRASKRTSASVELCFDVPVLLLPHTDDVSDALAQLNQEALGEVWPAFSELGIFATVESSRVPAADGPTPHSVQKGIYYRLPRLVWLSIYERTGESSARLIERRQQLVYDAVSKTDYLPMESGAWGEKSVTATLDGGSAPSKVTVGSVGSGAAIAGALGGAGDQVTKGLTDASSVTKELDALRDHRIDRQIALLDKNKSLLEKQVAADTSGSDLILLRELRQLKQQIATLKARNELAGLQAPPAPPPATDAVTAKRIVISLE